MRFEKLPEAEIRPGDSAAMRAAINVLTTEGADVRRPAGNEFQLKVAPRISYYPTTRTILIDGEMAGRTVEDLPELIVILRSHGVIDG